MHGELAQHLLKHQHLGLTAGRPQTKPPQHHQPEGTETAPLAEEQPNAEEDRRERQQPPRGCRHLNPLPLTTGEVPHQGLEDQATIQGKPRKEVEQRQHQVHPRQLEHQIAEQSIPVGSSMGRREQRHRQHQTHQGARSCNTKSPHRR